MTSWTQRSVERIRRRLAGDEGLSLVELLVSITLLATVMSGVSAGVVKSLQVARENAETVRASVVVHAEFERLRSIPFASWAVSSQNGTSRTFEELRYWNEADQTGLYHVFTEGTWVEAGTETSGCQTALTGLAEGDDYVRVTQTIRFPMSEELLGDPSRDRMPPVVNQTIISPRYESFDPDRGNVAVIVRDRDGEGLPNTRVVLSGGANSTEYTDSDGCAFFPLLAVGTYEVTLQRTGYIDRVTLVAEPRQSTAVQAGATSTVEFEYDEAVHLLPFPEVTAPSPLPAGWTVKAPDDLSYSLLNPNVNAAGRIVLGGPGLVTPTSSPDLYPFHGGYGVHAGRCATSDPSNPRDTSYDFGASAVQFGPEPGEDLPAPVPMATATIRVTDVLTGQPIAGAQVAIGQALSLSWCSTPVTSHPQYGDHMVLGVTGADGTLRAAVPFGRWHVDALNVVLAVTGPVVEFRADGEIRPLTVSPLVEFTDTLTYPGSPTGTFVNPVDGYVVDLQTASTGGLL